jgi:hypothetical protein
VDEYLLLTVLSHPGEPQADFASRLSRFWTQMLRQRQDDFEKVFAETTSFEEQDGRWSRQYLIEPSVSEVLQRELSQAGLEHEPIGDDVYSRYEAVPPEWMQIEH